MADYLYDTIRRLVAFDTVSANSNLEAAQFLADRLHRAGFKTTFQKVEIFGVPHANLIAWAWTSGSRWPDHLGPHRYGALLKVSRDGPASPSRPTSTATVFMAVAPAI